MIKRATIRHGRYGYITLDLPLYDQERRAARSGYGLLAVRELYVDPMMRRQGIGDKLMREACRTVDQAQRDLVLYVRPYGGIGPRTDTLVHFYAEHGFTKLRRAPSEENVTMVRRWAGSRT